MPDFAKGQTHELVGGQFVQDQGRWLPKGSKVEIVDNAVDFDGTLTVRFPSGRLGSIVPAMLVGGAVASFEATPAPAVAAAPAKTPAFAEFIAEVTLPAKPKIVQLNGIDHFECRVPLVFRTGSYPDKGFSMTQEEARASLKDFHDNVKEAPMPISHKPTVFDKHNTAKLIGLEIKETAKGTDFSAKALIPKWLHDFIKKDGAWGTSVRWTNEPGEVKRLVHAAFVTNPRIEGASVVASEFDADKVVAEFERVIPTISGYAAGASNINGQTVDNDDDNLPPVPADPVDPNKAPLPKAGPSTMSEADHASPNDDRPAAGGVLNADTVDGGTDEDLEDAGPADDGGSTLHGDELFSAISELVDGAIQDAQADNTRDPKYVAKLTAIKAALDQAGAGAEKPADTPGDVAKPERANGDVLPSFTREDEMRCVHPVDLAVVGKQLTPFQGENWKAELRRLVKADRKMGVTDFDAADSLFAQKVMELRKIPVNPMIASVGGHNRILSSDNAKNVEFEEDRTYKDRCLQMTEAGRRVLANRKPK